LRRQQWVKWVQLVTVLVWSLFPPFYSPVNAIWVPSAADPMVPVWEGEGEPTQNPAVKDSDGDGLSDWLEQYFGFSPGNPDSDYDGLSDSFELYSSGTNPLNWDSNSDGYSDHDAYYGSWNVHHHTAGFGVTVYDWDGDGFYNPNDSWPFGPNLDSDNDGTPDHQDPWPHDYYNGQMSMWYDYDGDGIHDNEDPWPYDPNNGNSPWLISDTDGDGFPDSVDTHPGDGGRWSDHNNNGHNDWNDTPYNTDTDNDGLFDGNDTDPNNAALWNDQFPRNGINDQDEPPPSSGYDPWITDSDGDSQMDYSDSHPGDASRWSDLNNNGFNDWEDTPYNMDRDNDGHFDGNDSDPDNGTLWNDHSPRDGINDPVTPPLTGGDGPMIADSDSDGRVDHSDSHPNDSSRWSDWDNDVLNAEVEQGLGTSPYHWDTDSDGLSDGEEVQYQTNPLVADMDGDGLTDREELLGTFGSSPRDKFSLSRGRGWGETYTDWHLADLTDTDGDGIPDKIEDLYAPYLNKQNAADAGWDADADGFTNLQAYLNGWTLRATINSIDRDGDGIEDAVEDLYPGILDKFNFADAVEDPDGDDLMNWQEVELPLQGYHPGDAQSRYAGVADHTARAWVALSGEVGLYLLQGGDWSSYRHLSRLPEGNYNVQMSHWVTMVDSDGTGLPDGLEAFLRDVAVEHGFVPGRVNPGDYDGDGMPDVWEWRYRGQLNLLSPTDAGPFGSVMPAPPLEPDASQFDLYLQEGVEAYQAAMGNYGAAMNARRLQDLDADGLSNLMEYQLNTHPLIPDSDGDSIPDGVEYQYGGDPNNGNNLPTTLLEITGGSAQAAVVGAVSNSPLTVLAVRAGVPRGNYAVQFNTNGFGKLGPTMAGPWSTQLVSVTNDAGLASIYWQAPLAAGSGNLQVRGSDVGSAPQNISATAQPTNGGGDGPGPGDGTNPPNPGTSPVPVDPWEMIRIMERSRKVFVSRSSGGIPSGAIVISPNGTPTGYFLPRRIKSFDGQQEMNDFLEPLERLPSGHYVDRHGEHLIEDDLLNIPAVSAWAVTYGDLSETISPQTWFYGGGWSEGTDLSAPLSSSESVAATIAAGGIDAPLASVLNELNMVLPPFAPADENWKQLPVRSQSPYYCVEHPSGGVLPPAGLVLSLQSASGDEVGEEEGEQYQGRFLVGSKRLYWMARTRPLNANGDPDMAAELPELTQTWLRVVERVTDDFGNALPTTPELNANGNPIPGSSVEVLQMDTVTLVMPEDALTSTETRVNGVTVMVPPGTFPGSVLLSSDVIGTRVSLLPVEIRVRQYNVQGPHGSAAMYAEAKPLDGNAVGELFSLWPNEHAFVTVGSSIAGMLQNNPPANFVKWSSAGLANASNQAEYEVHWNDPGLKEVNLEIGGKTFVVRINVPNTGTMRRDNDALKNQVGLTNWALCGALGIKARTNVSLWTGEAPETGGTKQDALRHSLWNMLSAAAIGRDHTIAITTANEHTGRMDQAAFSSNTTMDLFNNAKGAAEGAALYQPGGTPVDTLDAFNHMKGIFDSAGLRAWTPPANNVMNHHHMIRKSDQTTIYPRQ
jgi:hypothetical protein